MVSKNSFSSLSSKIRFFMVLRGINQRELSELSGLSSTTLTSILKHGSYPSLRTLVSLSRVFDCEVSDLFLFDDFVDFDSKACKK